MRTMVSVLGILFLVLLGACQPAHTPTAALPGPGDLTTPQASPPPTEAVPTAAQPPSFTDTPPPTLAPTPPLPAATLLEWVNLVEAHALPGAEWSPAQIDMPLYTGGEVWAKEASTALLNLGIELLRVAPNTIFTIDQPDANTLQINLQEGQIWLNVEGLEADQTLEVETPVAVASVRGTRFSVRVAAGDSTVVSAQAGSVAVSSPAGAVEVGEGQQTDVTPGQAPSPPAPMSIDESLRWEMAYGPSLQIAVPFLGIQQTISTTTITGDPSWSSDGGQLTFYDLDPKTDTYSYSAVYDTILQSFVTDLVPPDVYGAVFNPVQNSAAYIRPGPANDELCIASPASEPLCVGQPSIYLDKLTWAPNGQSLLVESIQGGSSTHALSIYGLDGNPLSQLTSSTGAASWNAAWSPDSRQVAYTVAGGSMGSVWMLNADGTQPTRLAEAPPSSTPLAWSKDGQWLALASAEKGLWLIAVDGSGAIQTAGTESLSCISAAWSPSPSGWPLIFSCQAAFAEPATTFLMAGPEIAPRLLGSFDWGPTWSPDGQRVALGDTSIDIGQQAFSSVIYILDAAPELWP